MPADFAPPNFPAVTPDSVGPAVEALLTKAEADFAAMEEGIAPTYAATVTATNRVFEPFERTWSPVGHLMGVRNSPELREAHAAAQPAVVRFGLRTAQSKPLHDALVALRDGPEWAGLSGVQRRIVSQKILSAELAGVALEGEAKEEFGALVEESSKLATEFSNHVLDATKAFSLVLTTGTTRRACRRPSAASPPRRTPRITRARCRTPRTARGRSASTRRC